MSSMYASRWSEITAATQRDYLTAVASLAPADRASKRIAGVLGKTSPEVASVRARLIAATVLVVDGPLVRFSLPGFDTWIALNA